MKKLWKEIKYWSQLFLLPIYGLSFLMPRNKKIWVYGSTFGRRFADNPKYFYLYTSQYQSMKVNAIWITKNPEIARLLRDNGLKGYCLYSIKGIWYSLRAAVYIYDNYSKDISFLLSGGAVKVNLWHGIPLKKIQKDNLFDYVRNPRNMQEKLRWALRRLSDEKPSHYVLATSEFIKPIFSSSFRTKNVLVNGYPRNDILGDGGIQLVSTEQEQRTLEDIYKLKEGKKLILYMPTFRNSETRFIEIINMDTLDLFLKNENMVFFIKPHPKSKLNKYLQRMDYKNIYMIDQEEDPYPILKNIDILITDYSSIYFDFLYMNRPIIFFSYDLSEYLSESRELYFNYREFTPGPRVFNQEELENALIDEDRYESERDKIKRKVFNMNSNNLESKKLYELINEILYGDRRGGNE